NIKKSYSHIRQKITNDEVTNLIDRKKNQYPVHTLCEVLEVPRSTYYKSLTKSISNRDQENQQVTKRIVDIYNQNKKQYGAPKIHHIYTTRGLLRKFKACTASHEKSWY